jgi:cell division septal protein FtsQ
MATPSNRKSKGLSFSGKPGRVAQNRMKRERKKIDYFGIAKKSSRIAGIAVVIALAGLMGYEAYSLVAKTSFFRLERIKVSQLKQITREEIIAQAGIKEGDDLLRLNLGRMGEQLAKNPWIAKVKVRRYLPNTIAIDLVEQEPVAVASMGYLYYLNARGEFFKPLRDGDRLDFPVFTGVTEDDLARDPAGSKEAISSMLSLLELLKKGTAFKAEDVSEIHYDKGYGFTIFLAHRGLPVRLGRNDLGGKLARLEKIYATLQPQIQTLEYIDLDYTDKIVVKAG